MSYIENESLVGTKDGSNKVFTTVQNASEIDSIRLNHSQIVDYSFTSPNSVTLDVPPQSTDILVVSYWTTASLVGSGAPYSTGSTLADLTRRVRTGLGEHFSEEWADQSIADWLNEGINRICSKTDWPFMESEAHIYTVTGQESYQLPAGFKKMIGVLNGTSEISHSDSREGIYSGYTILGDMLIFAQPSSPSEVRVRYFRYLPYFDWLVQTGTCGIPFQYEDVLVDYAIMRGKEAEELYDVARIHEQKFENGLNRMVLDLTRRVDAEYPSIRPLTPLF